MLITSGLSGPSRRCAEFTNMILGNNWRRLSLDNSDDLTSFYKVRWILVMFVEAVDKPSSMAKKGLGCLGFDTNIYQSLPSPIRRELWFPVT